MPCNTSADGVFGRHNRNARFSAARFDLDANHARKSKKTAFKKPICAPFGYVKTIDPTPDGLGFQTANDLHYKRGWSFR